MKALVREPLFWAALAVRLVLMPVTLHGDLLFIQYFPSFLSLHGIWDIYGYFGDHYLHRGYTYYAPLVYFWTGFFQSMTLPVSPDFAGLMARVHESVYPGASVRLEEVLGGMEATARTRLVFWMKFSYLLADLGCMALIASLPEEAAKKRKMLVAWAWHPVILFSVYAFGQYRMITALLTWTVLWLARRGRIQTACVFYGALCLADNFPLLLLPIFVWVFSDTWRGRLAHLSIILVSATTVLAPLAVLSKGYVFHVYFSPIVLRMATQSVFQSFAPVVATASKALFAALLAAVTLRVALSRPKPGRDRVGIFVCASAVILLSLYATTTAHVHYFMWILPFWVLISSEGAPWPRRLGWFFVFLLFLFNVDSRPMNAGLLAPVLSGAENLPSLAEWAGRLLPWGKLVAGSRLIFSALCLFFAARLWRARLEPSL